VHGFLCEKWRRCCVIWRCLILVAPRFFVRPVGEKLQEDKKFHVLRGRQSTRRTLQVMKTQGAPAQTKSRLLGVGGHVKQSFPTR
jgi:hypothetical protein